MTYVIICPILFSRGREMTDILNVTPEQVQDLKKNFWTYFAIQFIGIVCLLTNVYLNSKISFTDGLSMQVSMSWLSIITLTLNVGLVYLFSKLKSDSYLEVYTQLFVNHLREIAKEQVERDVMENMS